MEVGMHQAKTTLSGVDQKKLHEDDHVDIVITRSGQPVARLIRYEPLVAPHPGRLAGKITITDDFDATPDEVIEAFYR